MTKYKLYLKENENDEKKKKNYINNTINYNLNGGMWYWEGKLFNLFKKTVKENTSTCDLADTKIEFKEYLNKLEKKFKTVPQPKDSIVTVTIQTQRRSDEISKFDENHYKLYINKQLACAAGAVAGAVSLYYLYKFGRYFYLRRKITTAPYIFIYNGTTINFKYTCNIYDKMGKKIKFLGQYEYYFIYDDDKILYFEFDQVKQKKHIIKNEKLIDLKVVNPLNTFIKSLLKKNKNFYIIHNFFEYISKYKNSDEKSYIKFLLMKLNLVLKKKINGILLK